MDAPTLSPEDAAMLAHARERLAYDPATGIFTHLRATPGHAVGTTAGAMHANGHLLIHFKPYHVWAGQLAWLMHHNRRPKGRVWHKNSLPWDYRIDNLQEGKRPPGWRT